MNVAGYLRVSTDRQAEEGLGLDIQEQAIRAWAHTNGHRVVSWFRDEGLSGSNGLEHRDGLADALECIKHHSASGLVVYRLDRLARDLVLQEQLLADIRRLGADVYSTSTAEAAYLRDDPDDPSRKLIRQILGAVNEYERAMIRLRLSAGRRRKAEIGGYAYGAPPYGYRTHDGALVEDPDEQAGLRRMRDLRAGGASYRDIAAMLQAEGHEPKRGKVWYPMSVRQALARATTPRS
jgi:DNA invertase Pin-like site-specific DNA recombinase